MGPARGRLAVPLGGGLGLRLLLGLGGAGCGLAAGCSALAGSLAGGASWGSPGPRPAGALAALGLDPALGGVLGRGPGALVLGLALGEEVLPGGAHRLGVVEVLPVDLVDQPDVGAELRTFEPAHYAPPSARDPGRVQFATDAVPLSAGASRAVTARRARSMALSSSCRTATMSAPARMADARRPAGPGRPRRPARRPPGRSAPAGHATPAGRPRPGRGRARAGRRARPRWPRRSTRPGTPAAARTRGTPAEHLQPLPPRRHGPQGGGHDLLQEARPGGVDGGQLRSSLDPNSTYTLLFGIPVASANRPMDNPSSPSTVASLAACPRISLWTAPQAPAAAARSPSWSPLTRPLDILDERSYNPNYSERSFVQEARGRSPRRWSTSSSSMACSTR